MFNPADGGAFVASASIEEPGVCIARYGAAAGVFDCLLDKHFLQLICSNHYLVYSLFRSMEWRRAVPFLQHQIWILPRAKLVIAQYR